MNEKISGAYQAEPRSRAEDIIRQGHDDNLYVVVSEGRIRTFETSYEFRVKQQALPRHKNPWTEV